MRNLFAPQETSPFFFWRGFNPIGLIALAAGFLIYVVIFNPQTLDNAPIFVYVTASIPSCVGAGLIHYVLTRLFARRMGWGDYPA
jgi:NCS1 family nucleobase:cation symporter-1